MRSSLWFFPLWCLFVSSALVHSTEFTREELQQFYGQEIVSMQLMERPPGSEKEDKDGLANEHDAKHRGVLVTLKDGQQFFIHMGKGSGPDAGGSAGSSAVEDGRHLGDHWHSVGGPVTARRGYRFEDAIHDCERNRMLMRHRQDCPRGAGRMRHGHGNGHGNGRGNGRGHGRGHGWRREGHN